MAAGPTYEPIATTTGSGSSNTISFTSIPSTYTDLVLVCNAFVSSDAINMYTTVNGGGSGYTQTWMGSNGSATSKGRVSSSSQWTMSNGPLGNGSSTAPMYMQMQFFNYANTNKNKVMLARQSIIGATYNGTVASVNLWDNTSAINRIDVYCQAGAYYLLTGATFTLYGIAAA